MQKWKKVLAATCAVAVCAVGVPMGGIMASAETAYSGTCGENLQWTLDYDGVLTITGTGAMTDFDGEDDIPWYSRHDGITAIVIEEGVTKIGEGAFYECYAENVQIADTVTDIGGYAFCRCYDLSDVTIPASVDTIGEGAFALCYSLEEINVADENANYCSVDGSREITLNDAYLILLYYAQNQVGMNPTWEELIGA